MSRLTETLDLARRIAALGLEGAEAGMPIDVPQELWAPVFGHLANQRLTGVAVAGLRTGALSVPASGESELFEAHRRAMVLVISLERRLTEVAAALTSAGVEVVVLKGPALAHGFYPDPAMRSFGDLDLLIPARHWRGALAVLRDLGFRRLIPEPRPGFDERFGKGASHEDADSFQVDLHRTLALGPFGMWMDPDALFERTEELQLGASTFRRLSDTMTLLHACIHAGLGRRPPLLLPLRDVLQVAGSGRIDWEELADATRGWRLTAPAAYALKAASEVLGTPIPEPARLLAASDAPASERRALAAYTTDRRGSGGLELAMLGAIRGLPSKAAYIRAMVFPRREFLDVRGGRRGARWTRPLRWARDRLRVGG